MYTRSGWFITIASSCLMFFTVVAGCKRGEQPGGPSTTLPENPVEMTAGTPPGASQTQTSQSQPVQAAAPHPPTEQLSAQPEQQPEQTPEQTGPVMPEVKLSESMLASCVLKVGGVLPGGRLPDVNGTPHLLRDLLGDKLSVICFFSAGDSVLSQMVAEQLLKDLERYVYSAYKDQEVQVIAIAVGDSAKKAKTVSENARPSFPVLVDEAKAYFALVARQILPRIYVVDHEGKVLWFDLAFTELAGKTRDDLLAAIDYVLSQTATDTTPAGDTTSEP